ncbi:hypothetical protein DIJ64_02675 [Mycobacterium leprae]|uniref:Uncharacterized protein n=1 Tax=Mycobacterium leprae TaxID=1769 RepID=A0AAD0P7A9_MYCLR|nr:hypothetical protein DIJ64_02675 [Mycobacterium leprae]OAR20236.1 hypothetical protein A8144_03040 [Mycobacterium leprae 3125609]OAX71165.1 hypothetical protein A3216_07425 [Mycobacterium leprae 7935681]
MIAATVLAVNLRRLTAVLMFGWSGQDHRPVADLAYSCFIPRAGRPLMYLAGERLPGLLRG